MFFVFPPYAFVPCVLVPYEFMPYRLNRMPQPTIMNNNDIKTAILGLYDAIGDAEDIRYKLQKFAILNNQTYDDLDDAAIDFIRDNSFLVSIALDKILKKNNIYVHNLPAYIVQELVKLTDVNKPILNRTAFILKWYLETYLL